MIDSDKHFIDELRNQDYVGAIDMLDEIILKNVEAYKQKVKEAINKAFIFSGDANIKRKENLLRELGLE